MEPTRALYRSGMLQPGRSSPCWRVTRHEWVRKAGGALPGRRNLCQKEVEPPTWRAHFTLLPSPGALAWNADQLSSGSRDRMILQRDIRTPPLQSERRLQGHRQEVCGLKWSTDHQLLASGGNDNKVRQKKQDTVPGVLKGGGGSVLHFACLKFLIFSK